MTFGVKYDLINEVMRDKIIKVGDSEPLVCDVCNRQDGAKSEWEGYITVAKWGNPYDHGTICDECQEDMTYSLHKT